VLVQCLVRLVRLLFMPYIAYAISSFLISSSSFVFCLLSSEFNFGFPSQVPTSLSQMCIYIAPKIGFERRRSWEVEVGGDGGRASAMLFLSL